MSDWSATTTWRSTPQATPHPAEEPDRRRRRHLHTGCAERLPFKVIAVPGHTTSHIAYVGEAFLFCGDTLFSVGCGRLFEGTPEQMLASLWTVSPICRRTPWSAARTNTPRRISVSRLASIRTTAPCASVVTRWRVFARRSRPSVPSRLGDEIATNPFPTCVDSEAIADWVEAHGSDHATRTARFRRAAPGQGQRRCRMNTMTHRLLPTLIPFVLGACAGSVPRPVPQAAVAVTPVAPVEDVAMSPKMLRPAPPVDFWSDMRGSFAMPGCETDPQVMAWAHTYTKMPNRFEQPGDEDAARRSCTRTSRRCSTAWRASSPCFRGSKASTATCRVRRTVRLACGRSCRRRHARSDCAWKRTTTSAWTSPSPPSR